MPLFKVVVQLVNIQNLYRWIAVNRIGNWLQSHFIKWLSKQ
uniref:Uncharacterized protein n=1 Tax=Anguilla anguilla TaxID=7936 RepID=A0A0E9PTA1_ANGAN